MRSRGWIAVCWVLAGALPLHAGRFDWLTGKKAVPAAVAEARLNGYINEVLKCDKLEVSKGRNELTSGERSRIDPKVLTTLEKPAEMLVVDVKGNKTSGFAVLAGTGISKESWDPATGFLGFVFLSANRVFPADADRALSLCVSFMGEPAFFGTGPEAGTVYRPPPTPMGPGGRPGRRFLPGASFAGDDGEDTVEPYRARSGEKAPPAEDIPAWVFRGSTKIPGKGEAQLELGLLAALKRGPKGKGVIFWHAAGSMEMGKHFFIDKDPDEEKKDDKKDDKKKKKKKFGLF